MRATPDFDFQLGEAAEMIRDTTARFADEQIAPLADRTDREDRFPRELWEPMGALGLHGITVAEVLCSSHDQRCIAVPLHVDWPTFPCPQCAADMRTAFAQLSMRAFDAHQTELPPIYADQQRQLDAEMALMNRQFGKLLKFYALRHLRDAFAPTEQLEKATLTQLNFEGLSLECETILLSDEELGGVLKRFRWSGSVLYDTPCRSAEEVEDRLIAMFTDETETTRDASRTRDAAPPPARADKYEAAAKAAWLARLNLPAWGRGAVA